MKCATSAAAYIACSFLVSGRAAELGCNVESAGFRHLLGDPVQRTCSDVPTLRCTVLMRAELLF